MQRWVIGALGLGVMACSVAANSASSSSGGGATSSSSSSSSSGGSSGVMVSLGSSPPGMPHADLADDAEVPIIAGPQGGHHIWLSVGLPAGTVSNLSDGLEAQYHLTNGATVVADGRTYISLREEGGIQQDTGATMFLMEDPSVVDLMHQPLDVSITLRTASGTTLATAHRRWKATCCSSGGFGGGDGTRGDGGATGNGPVDCNSYCALVAPGCGNSTPPLYSSPQACQADCATFSRAGPVDFGAGNTLQCRAYYAQRSVGDVGSCSRLKATLDAFCVDGCGYYCKVMSDRCPLTAFSSTCAQACAAYPTTGQRGDVSGNTLQCRIHFAELAIPDPLHACANASAGGGTDCVP